MSFRHSIHIPLKVMETAGWNFRSHIKGSPVIRAFSTADLSIYAPTLFSSHMFACFPIRSLGLYLSLKSSRDREAHDYARLPSIQDWQEVGPGADAAPGRLPVTAIREGEVPGIHSVTWDSEADSITITHSAKSRRGFALGAVLAAEWLAGRKGFHTMAEMLSDYTKTSRLFV